MTSYHGGKQILGKDIAFKISRIYSIKKDQIEGYVEPFCGMLGVYTNVISEIGPGIQYKAGDINGSVIEMWKKAQAGWRPPLHVTREQYQKLRKTRFQTPDSAAKGYIGHQYSFRGIYFGAWREDHVPPVNHTKARNRILDMAQTVHAVEFTKGPYTQFSEVKNYIIYCDPPYKDKAQKYLEKFDFDAFIQWCKKMAKDNIVIVSNSGYIKGAILLFERMVRNMPERLFLILNHSLET